VVLVADLIEKGELPFRPDWVHPIHQQQILEAATRLGMDLLKPIKEAVPEQVSYEEIRLVVAHARRRENRA